jgi:allantoin racemase
MRIRVIRPDARDFRPYTPSEVCEQTEDWASLASPGTLIEVSRALKGAETIECFYDAEIAAPFLLEEVKKAESEGVDGVLIACMVDPALHAARELARIPVVGEGLACFATAATLGYRFSVISPEPGAALIFRNRVRAYGLEGYLASIRALETPVRGLRADLDVLRQAMCDAGRQAVEKDGADVIVPGCGQIWGLSSELSEALGVPVLDPRATALRFTEMVVGLGLSHSKRTYPYPPDKRREI